MDEFKERIRILGNIAKDLGFSVGLDGVRVVDIAPIPARRERNISGELMTYWVCNIEGKDCCSPEDISQVYYYKAPGQDWTIGIQLKTGRRVEYGTYETGDAAKEAHKGLLIEIAGKRAMMNNLPLGKTLVERYQRGESLSDILDSITLS